MPQTQFQDARELIEMDSNKTRSLGGSGPSQVNPSVLFWDLNPPPRESPSAALAALPVVLQLRPTSRKLRCIKQPCAITSTLGGVR